MNWYSFWFSCVVVEVFCLILLLSDDDTLLLSTIEVLLSLFSVSWLSLFFGEVDLMNVLDWMGGESNISTWLFSLWGGEFCLSCWSLGDSKIIISFCFFGEGVSRTIILFSSLLVVSGFVWIFLSSIIMELWCLVFFIVSYR